MRSGWPLASLTDILVLNRSGFWGESYPRDQSLVPAKVVRNGDISSDGKLRGYAERFLTRREADASRLVAGDIAFTTSGEVGKAWLVAEAEGLFASNFVRIFRADQTKVLPRFLRYSLATDRVLRALVANTTGTTIRNVQKGFYQAAEFALPSIPEQRRIVAILDEAFAAIAKARANTERTLRDADALFQSHLDTVCAGQAEHWVTAPLGEAVRFVDYRGRTPKKTEAGLRLITAKNVKMGYLQEHPREFVSPEIYDSWMTRGIPKAGDVLFTTEAPLANVAQLDTDEKVVFAQRVIIMQPDTPKLDGTFLKYLLRSSPVQRRIHAKGTGATVRGIKASLLKKIAISYPTSLVEQRAIASSLDALAAESARLKAVGSKKLAFQDELKQSLLHQAFSGGL